MKVIGPRGEECVPWSCDYCMAACTFEAISWCSKRQTGECGHDEDQPHALDRNGVPRAVGDVRGVFEFVWPRRKAEQKVRDEEKRKHG